MTENDARNLDFTSEEAIAAAQVFEQDGVLVITPLAAAIFERVTGTKPPPTKRGWNRVLLRILWDHFWKERGKEYDNPRIALQELQHRSQRQRAEALLLDIAGPYRPLRTFGRWQDRRFVFYVPKSVPSTLRFFAWFARTPGGVRIAEKCDDRWLCPPYWFLWLLAFRHIDRATAQVRKAAMQGHFKG